MTLALTNHTCTTTRGNTMSTQPLRSVPDPGKRPHPRELVAHDAQEAGIIPKAIVADYPDATSGGAA